MVARPARPIRSHSPVNRPEIALHRMQTQQETTTSLWGRVHHLTYSIRTEGAGEVGVDVSFPCKFTEEPMTFFGGALALNQEVVDGSFPTVTVVVGRWDVQEFGFGGLETVQNVAFYQGAHLQIVTTGLSAQVMNVHWHAIGTALRGGNSSPEGGTQGTTDDSI